MRCPFVDSRNDRLNDSQSNDFLKFWRNRLSHERPHLAIWVKLSRPVCVSISSMVLKKKDWIDLLKFFWPARAFEIISLSWIRGLIFIFLNTFFGFVLCRLRGAVKLPQNGLLYTQVIENYLIVKFLTKYCEKICYDNNNNNTVYCQLFRFEVFNIRCFGIVGISLYSINCGEWNPLLTC